VSDMLVALEGILQSENERILCLSVDLTVKLVCSLGRSIRQYHMLDVIISLSCLLPTCQVSVAVQCAVALNHIITHLRALSCQHSEEVWKAMAKTNVVGSIICAMQDYEDGVQPIEYFTEMASLLKTIIWRWPLFRYQVWSNAKLMVRLQDICAKNDTLITLRVLQLCSVIGITLMVISLSIHVKIHIYLPYFFCSIHVKIPIYLLFLCAIFSVTNIVTCFFFSPALCGNGAMKILENKELLSKIVQSIGTSQPDNIRVEALKLCRHLMV